MQLFLSSACQSLSLLVCLWFFLFSSFDALFVLLYPIIISLLTFLCIIKPQTKCSATLNRWLARPEKGGEKTAENVGNYSICFHTTQHRFVAEQTVNRKMHHYWMIVASPAGVKIRHSTLFCIFHNSNANPRILWWKKGETTVHVSHEAWRWRIGFHVVLSTSGYARTTRVPVQTGLPRGSPIQLCGPPKPRLHICTTNRVQQQQFPDSFQERGQESKEGEARRKSLAWLCSRRSRIIGCSCW